MTAVLRIVSVVAFLSLVTWVALLLLTDQHAGPAALGLLVAGVFALPATLLSLALFRARAAVAEYAEMARHLAGGRTAFALDESSERYAPDLVKGLAQVAVELERREREYEQHRDAIRHLLDGLGEGVLAIDLDRRVRLANRRTTELFQMRETVEGRHYLEVIRNAQLVGAFDRALRGETAGARATLDVAGDSRQIEMRVFPLGRGDLAAVALFIDVTEIEKLQSVRREFMADFHHEVRTPLAGLRVASETLAGGGATPEQTEQLKRIIERQVRRLERLVEEAGQLNEIESGEMLLHLEPVDLRELLQDVADDFADSAAQRGIALAVEGEPVVATVDATKIQQVVSNLVDNAIKHSGTTRIHLEVSSGDGSIRVAVTDSGEGIEPADQEKIFRRFYRAEKSRSGAVEGTGLGLAIAKHVMRRHGGSIAVSSERGRGARFELSFPM